MRYPTYHEYKESGVQWLGPVPGHWEVKRLKMTAHLNDKKVEADEDNPVLYIGMENIESWTGKLLPIDPDVVPTGVANRFTAKNTLFGKLRPYLAKACNPGFDGLCSTELLVIESEDLDRRALLYWLLADGFIKLVDSSTYGSKMPRANWDFIGNCLLPVPPLPEQTAIADFLDREIGRIDTLVAKKRRLIALLKEQRTALISRTVTRGLPADAAREFGLEPHTRFKDSGIEWLGQVPEGWEIKKLSWLFSYSKGKNAASLTKETIADSPGDFPVFSGQTENNGLMGCIDSYEFDFKLPVIFVTTVGAKAMSTRLVNGQFSLSQNCALIIPRKSETKPGYYIGVLQRLFDYERRSISLIMQPSLRFDDLNRFWVPVPPEEEQTNIAIYLDRETAKIDKMLEKVESAIARLQEYRTALITSAVTGKIDVREAVA